MNQCPDKCCDCVDALRKENERLTDKVKVYEDNILDCESLMKENLRLRECLEKIEQYPKEHDSYPDCSCHYIIGDIAKQALCPDSDGGKK